MREIKLNEGELRLIVPGGAVDINASLNDADGNPVVRVDVVPDAPHYGPDKEGREWEPVNGDAGVVRLVGKKAADKEIVPATPEEYRKMLDGLNLYTRVVDNGFDAFWMSGAVMVPLKFRRARNDWWEIIADDGSDTLLWCSAYASADTREYIENWIRSRWR
jgi:hypothetical protein